MAKLSKELPEKVLTNMYDYYAELLSEYKDDCEGDCRPDGYAKTTINNWCNCGVLKSFRKG